MLASPDGSHSRVEDDHGYPGVAGADEQEGDHVPGCYGNKLVRPAAGAAEGALQDTLLEAEGAPQADQGRGAEEEGQSEAYNAASHEPRALGVYSVLFWVYDVEKPGNRQV